MASIIRAPIAMVGFLPPKTIRSWGSRCTAGSSRFDRARLLRSRSSYGNVQQWGRGIAAPSSAPMAHVGDSSEFSAPMNAREPSGSILPEMDHTAALKQYQSDVSTSRSQPDHPLWNFLQQAAVYVLATIVAYSFPPNAAHAVAENSIGASSLGFKVAEFLRRSGLSDELVVLTVAMLPVLELRGAIPISYWLKLEPVKGYILAVIGNMIPVPFIVLYLEKLANSIGEGSETGRRLVSWVFERTQKKAGPIAEFQWIGLLLFVAVPLPGTGAWTGAIAASILGMSFWDSITANFLGVALAGLLVNLIVVLGYKEAFLVGAFLSVCSIFMWSALRVIQQKKSM